MAERSFHHEIEALRARHRSPLILDCIHDYQLGRRYPLDLIRDYPDAPEVRRAP